MKKYIFHSESGISCKVTIEKGQYSNGQASLQLIDAKNGDLVLTATVCEPNITFTENETLIKDYSENEGVLDFLIENNLVELMDESIKIGYTIAQKVKVLSSSN